MSRTEFGWVNGHLYMLPSFLQALWGKSCNRKEKGREGGKGKEESEKLVLKMPILTQTGSPPHSVRLKVICKIGSKLAGVQGQILAPKQVTYQGHLKTNITVGPKSQNSHSKGVPRSTCGPLITETMYPLLTMCWEPWGEFYWHVLISTVRWALLYLFYKNKLGNWCK